MTFNKDVMNRLMSDAKRDKWYGNPFQYILENWTRGKELLDSANKTYGGNVDKIAIKSAKVAYDVWIDILTATVSGRHGDIKMDPNDFYSILVQVDRLLSVGLGEREIKNKYYKVAFKLKDDGIVGQDAFIATTGTMDTIALETQQEHQAILEDQLNNYVKKHEGACSECHGSGGRMGQADNVDWLECTRCDGTGKEGDHDIGVIAQEEELE